ncbi:ROK family protein [Paenibacillus sp. strain BS8-2]
MALTIGVDVGGTNIVCGVVDETGQVIGKRKRPTEAHLGAASVLDRIAAMAEELRTEYGSQDTIGRIGIGIPGLVDPQAGLSRFAGNLNWRNIPVASELEQRIGIPTFLDNDVKLYVYGEAVAGAGRGYRHVLGITIGTGIASAAVSDGKLLYGHKAMAGEIGHVRMDGIEEACTCGLSGCLETVASASGMLRQTHKRLAAGRDSILRQWFPGDAISEITGADLSKALDAGDSLATEILTRAGRLCGRALAAAAAVLSPEVIIVGGGGALAGERLLGPLREELFANLIPEFRDGLKVVAAENNDEAGIIGSALYARDQR